MSALFAAWLLLMVDVCVCLFCLRAVPVERLLARFPRVGRRVERLGERVRGSRLARRGLATALWGALVLPFHSGGAIFGTLGGRVLGLPRPAVFAAVVGAVAARFGVVLLATYGIFAALS